MMARNLPDDEIDQILRKNMVNRFCEGYDTYGDEKIFLTKYYKNFEQPIEDLEIMDTDVIVASFPKSGTTWTQEMVWLICNDLDYQGAQMKLLKRFLQPELGSLINLEEMEREGIFTDAVYDIAASANQQSSRRYIKTHLPYSLLPFQIKSGLKKPKMVYVIRNPKDVCTSYYYHTRMRPDGHVIILEDFVKLFLADKIAFTPYWKHILGYWEHRNDPNLLIINYEDMKNDLPSVIRKVSDFFGKHLTEEQVAKLSQHLSFDSMKNNQAVNYEEFEELDRKLGKLDNNIKFMRSGTVGQYKQELSSETIEIFDRWIKQNIEGTSFGQQYNYSL